MVPAASVPALIPLLLASLRSVALSGGVGAICRMYGGACKELPIGWGADAQGHLELLKQGSLAIDKFGVTGIPPGLRPEDLPAAYTTNSSRGRAVRELTSLFNEQDDEGRYGGLQRLGSDDATAAWTVVAEPNKVKAVLQQRLERRNAESTRSEAHYTSVKSRRAASEESAQTLEEGLRAKLKELDAVATKLQELEAQVLEQKTRISAKDDTIAKLGAGTTTPSEVIEQADRRDFVSAEEVADVALKAQTAVLAVEAAAKVEVAARDQRIAELERALAERNSALAQSEAATEAAKASQKEAEATASSKPRLLVVAEEPDSSPTPESQRSKSKKGPPSHRGSRKPPAGKKLAIPLDLGEVVSTPVAAKSSFRASSAEGSNGGGTSSRVEEGTKPKLGKRGSLKDRMSMFENKG